MKSFGFSLLLTLVFFQTSLAQQIRFKSAQRVTQIGVADPKLFDDLMVLVPEIGSHSRNVLERQNLKPFMMPVRQLGFRGDDMCYTLTSCLEYYLNLKKNYKINLSPDYISLNLAATGRAPSAKDVLNFLVKDGTVNAAILPYDAGEITNAVFATQKYKINNFLFLFNGSTRTMQKTFETKKALIRGNPVIVELQADEKVTSFREHEWGPARSGDYRYSFIVVGFDEEAKTFELRSNFGNDWANNGYIHISYDTFGQLASNGYVMIPEEYYQSEASMLQNRYSSKQQQMTRIGLISDTHSHLEDKVFDHFAACDEIWHAGDIGDIKVADQLAAFKPFRAVYGNIDAADVRMTYPLDLHFHCEAVKVWMTHIGGYPGRYSKRIKDQLPEVDPDLFICGHSHILKVMPDAKHNLLHINPGAAGVHGFHQVKTIIRFTIDGKQIKDLEVIEMGRRGALTLQITHKRIFILRRHYETQDDQDVMEM